MKNFADYYHQIISLQKNLHKELPTASDLIDKLSTQSSQDGVLSKKQKALMALSIAISNQSDEQLAIHLHEAMHAGVSRTELLETIELCTALGGRSAWNFGALVYAAALQLEEDSDDFRDSFYT